jgi:hypothetical protein
MLRWSEEGSRRCEASSLMETSGTAARPMQREEERCEMAVDAGRRNHSNGCSSAGGGNDGDPASSHHEHGGAWTACGKGMVCGGSRHGKLTPWRKSATPAPWTG